MPANSGCTPMLRALADDTRWQIVHRLLAVDRAMVTTLSDELKIRQSNMSKHLRILRDAGIVDAEKEGTAVWCCIAPSFRQRLRGGEMMLDLGCCTFRFDQSPR